MMDSDNILMTVLGAAAVALLVLLVVLEIKGQQDWDKFKAEHQCKVVAHIDGSTFSTVGFSSKGQPVVGVGSAPSKTGWLCDDGVTYYK